MSRKFELNAELRQPKGKRAARRLQRLEAKVPAIMYGAGKEPQAIALSQLEVLNALKNDAIYSHILTLHVDNQAEKVILKDLQRHPWKSQILHVDFLRINENEKLTISVPVHFKGEASSPGVKSGGIVSKTLTEIEVRCLPADLPESFELDLSKLELDQAIHLSDLELPKGVELTVQDLSGEQNQPIVSIHLPRAAKEEEETPSAAALAAIEAAETKPEESKESKPKS